MGARTRRGRGGATRRPGRRGPSVTFALVAAAHVAPSLAAAQSVPPDARPIPGVDYEVPGLVVSLSEEAYPISAPTFAGLVRTLNGMSIEGEGAPLSQGLTQYHILPEWSVAAAGGACRVASPRVRVTVVVTLPVWTAADTASQDERGRWEAIHERIREHEYEHRDMTLEAAASLLDRIRDLSARGCAQLRRSVEGEIALTDRRLTERHAALDRSGGIDSDGV